MKRVYITNSYNHIRMNTVNTTISLKKMYPTQYRKYRTEATRPQPPWHAVTELHDSYKMATTCQQASEAKQSGQRGVTAIWSERHML